MFLHMAKLLQPITSHELNARLLRHAFVMPWNGTPRFHVCSSSTSSVDYSLPRLRTKFGERAFSHAGPATWNALPDHIRTVAENY